jgi:hypothetical protein
LVAEEEERERYTHDVRGEDVECGLKGGRAIECEIYTEQHTGCEICFNMRRREREREAFI